MTQIGEKFPSWTSFSELADGYWRLRWNILECPNHWLRTTSSTFRRGKAFEEATIHVGEVALLFACPRGEFAIPNNPESLALLEQILNQARAIQKKMSESERIEEIRTMKRFGYLDANASEESPLREPLW
ncbi:hypothetical protein FJM51_22100 [Amaricoccus solimangrovi]|uniref:Uncharacterized protein n=1 Tax=Amaricoccus solimangrovi TaxID=2589815 RepID=A0A501WHA0_9RHOB|nr:hypothetical protein FJM51_22100 [Amaricoccus solimangrovi]